MNSNISKASTGDSNINKKRVSSPKLSRLPLYNSNPNLHPGRPSSPSLIPIKGEPGRGLVFVKHYTALCSIVQHELSLRTGTLCWWRGMFYFIFFFSVFSCDKVVLAFFCFCVLYTWTPSVSLTCSRWLTDLNVEELDVCICVQYGGRVSSCNVSTLWA